MTSSLTLFTGWFNHAAAAPDVAFFGGTNTWVVVYEYDVGGFGSDYDIEAIEIDLNGSFVGTPINVTAAWPSQNAPSVAGYAGGTQAFVTWKEGAPPGLSTLKGTRIVSGPSTVGPVVSFGGDITAGTRAPVHSDEISRYFTVWGDQRDKDSLGAQYDVYGSRVDWNGNLLDIPGGFLISKSVNTEVIPAVGYCGSNYLVAWSDTRNGYFNRDLYASLLSSSGTIVASPIAIATAASNQDAPAIACNGTNFYVVWTDRRNGNPDIYGSMLDGATGQVLNPGGVAIATGTTNQEHPAVAYGAGNFKVVWDASDVYVVFATISGTTGAVLGGPVTMTERDHNRYPDVAFDGTGFWVVWQTIFNGNQNIAGASLSASGTVGAITTIENDAATQRYPKVAWDSTSALYTVVYEDDRNIASTNTDIYARSFAANGVVNAAFPVATKAGTELAPHIASRTAQVHEVVYQHSANVEAQAIDTGVAQAIYTIADGTTTLMAYPAIACASSSSCLVPYNSVDTQSVNNPVFRIKARVVSYP